MNHADPTRRATEDRKFDDDEVVEEEEEDVEAYDHKSDDNQDEKKEGIPEVAEGAETAEVIPIEI